MSRRFTPHTVTFTHGPDGTTAICATCHCVLSDPTTEAEAVDAAIYHRRYEAPRIEGRAA